MAFSKQMTNQNDSYIIDLITMSKLGKNDGGTETWIYHFFPQLINQAPVELNIFGYRNPEETDHKADIIGFDDKGLERVKPFIIQGRKSRLPRFFSMFLKIKLFLKSFHKINNPNCTIAIGVFELIIMLTNKRFNQGIKVVWLRSIFLNEKSERIPLMFKGILKKIISYLLNKVDYIIVNGDDIKAYYQAQGHEITVIKNSVNIKKWHMTPPHPSKTMVVAYVGRLSKVKGIEIFFKLIENIMQSINADKFQFRIVGDANNYLSQVKKIENNGWIQYHGIVGNDDLPKILKEIDICVALTFASNQVGGGGTSNALMEQMAASKIILAWDNVIFQQLLNDNNAYLVEQYSTQGLEKKLLDIYSNQNEAIKKGQNARTTIEPYTINSQLEKFIKVINNDKRFYDECNRNH